MGYGGGRGLGCWRGGGDGVWDWSRWVGGYEVIKGFDDVEEMLGMVLVEAKL